tara:strand:+ start:92 stop:307 length:216 start_codon:yes stop_codon:yes gene_type:complete
MYGWYSKTQQQQTISERKKREYPYIYYIDMQDKIVLVTEVNKGNKINFEDAIPLGELKKFYRVSETPLKLD